MKPDKLANKQPIFITGRFRSGTSFMWQLFNHLDGFCAWYEPLHPQLIKAVEHVVPKEDHVGVADYWQTYRNHPRFKKYHSSEFATEYLYLEPQQRYPGLLTYINHLLELSSPLVPVLQFNRADFRLSWLKHNFPDATFIHIERNPIQLYYSQRKHISDENSHDADYWDAYELMQWCYALHEQFPFLLTEVAEQHAFYRFYAICQLSKQMAKVHADISINLDVDVFQSNDFVEKLSQEVALNVAQRQAITNLVHVPVLPNFDDKISAEYVAIMTEVDLMLSDSGLLEAFGQNSIKSIKYLNADYWNQFKGQPSSIVKIKVAIKQMSKELQRIEFENHDMMKQLHGSLVVADTETPDLGMIEQVDEKSTITALLNVMNEINNKMTEQLSENRDLTQQLNVPEA